MAGPQRRHTSDPPDRGWWRRLLPRNIRGRIVLVALVALAPVWLLVLGSALTRLFTVGNNALRENREGARVVAGNVEGYVQDIRRQAVLIGTAIGTRGQPNWGWTNRLLTTSADQNPTLRNLSWISSQGLVLASSVPAARGTVISGNAPLQQLRAGGTWGVSDLLPVAPISRTVSIVMAYAVREDTGQLLGIVLAEVNPDNLRDVLLRASGADGGVYAIFDRQGYLVISSPPRQGAWEERAEWRDTDPLLRRTLGDGETRGVVTPATFDAPLYAVYAPVAETGYIVGVLRPRARARADAWRSALRHLLLLLLVTGMVGLIAYRISRTMVDPVRTLQANIGRIERHEDTQPLADVAPTEIRTLQTALTSMAALLMQRIDNSETERNRLRTIIESMPVGVRFVNAGGEVLLANPRARELLGEDALGMASTPRGRYTLQRLDGSPLPMAEIPLVYALHEGQACRNAELIIRYEHGEGILALVSAMPVSDARGGHTGVIEVVVEVVSDVVALQEIIENTSLEQELDTVRTQLQTLLQTLPVGVMILDAQGQIISANAASTRLWGGVIPAVNAIGDFRFFHGWWTRTGEALRPDEWPPVRALTNNETVINDVVTLNRFDGLRGNVLTSAAPLHNAQGALSGAVWVLQDPIAPK